MLRKFLDIDPLILEKCYGLYDDTESGLGVITYAEGLVIKTLAIMPFKLDSKVYFTWSTIDACLHEEEAAEMHRKVLARLLPQYTGEAHVD